ncbi:hypothetical protein BCY76_010325 [Nesterenkonia sp. PF2B19]|nr:hypothetical protein [Nesterenkonia sp. PF2B19]OSM43088.1 hypothetical protein BCY76_010325 [Nesterenkonia sp. PF2B19]
MRAVSPLSGGFAAVYKVLAAAEDAGQVRRGYFIEQLGAAQFTTSATIDSLRATADALEDRAASEASPGPSGTTHGTRSADHPGGGPRSAWEHSSPNPVDPETAREVLVLAATDPANAYGAALDWPALEDSRHRPGRKAGAVVVLHRGELLLYMERGGRTLLVFTEEEHLLEAARAGAGRAPAPGPHRPRGRGTCQRAAGARHPARGRPAPCRFPLLTVGAEVFRLG